MSYLIRSSNAHIRIPICYVGSGTGWWLLLGSWYCSHDYLPVPSPLAVASAQTAWTMTRDAACLLAEL